MKVSELISALRNLNQDADVGYLYDGFILCPVEAVWTAREGHVLVNMYAEGVSRDMDRAIGAPLAADVPFLHVSDMLGVDYTEDKKYSWDEAEIAAERARLLSGK